MSKSQLSTLIESQQALVEAVKQQTAAVQQLAASVALLAEASADDDFDEQPQTYLNGRPMT